MIHTFEWGQPHLSGLIVPPFEVTIRPTPAQGNPFLLHEVRFPIIFLQATIAKARVAEAQTIGQVKYQQ